MMKNMRHIRKVCLVSAFVTILHGCGAGHDSADSFTSGNVRVNNRWPSTQIPVCWVNPTPADIVYRRWAQSGVEREYEGKTSFRFTGWGNCRDTVGSAVRIQIRDTRGWSYIGRSTASPSMVVSLARTNYASYCRKSTSLHRRCIEATVIHEFGHAIGLYHEQDRHDSSCHNGRDNTGGKPIGLYDPDSIMNYCNDTVTNPRLTRTDVQAVQYLAQLISPQAARTTAPKTRIAPKSLQLKAHYEQAQTGSERQFSLQLDGSPEDLASVSRIVYDVHPSFKERASFEANDVDSAFTTTSYSVPSDGLQTGTATVYFQDGQSAEIPGIVID